MQRRKRSSSPKVGQATIFGTIEGLDKLVHPPDVIESEGLKVIHFAVSEEDRAVPGYLDEIKLQARKLLPETKSIGRPPWMTAEWQTKRRKKREGVL